MCTHTEHARKHPYAHTSIHRHMQVVSIVITNNTQTFITLALLFTSAFLYGECPPVIACCPPLIFLALNCARPKTSLSCTFFDDPCVCVVGRRPSHIPGLHGVHHPHLQAPEDLPYSGLPHSGGCAAAIGVSAATELSEGQRGHSLKCARTRCSN